MTTELAAKPSTRAAAEMMAARAGERLLLLIPAFNEGTRLEAVLGEVRRSRPSDDILVVDDGSTDETADTARAAGAWVAQHPFNLGYGAALETGYQFALERGYDILVQMDGDGQHDPSALDALLAPVLENRSDVVVGSRFLTGSSYRSSRPRRLGSYLFGWVASFLTGKVITDPTSGFWAMNRKAFSALANGVLPHDYPDADILIGMHYAGLRLLEVPVVMRNADGKRSMHAGFRPVYYVFKMLLSIVLALLGRRPRSV